MIFPISRDELSSGSLRQAFQGGSRALVPLSTQGLMKIFGDNWFILVSVIWFHVEANWIRTSTDVLYENVTNDFEQIIILENDPQVLGGNVD